MSDVTYTKGDGRFMFQIDGEVCDYDPQKTVRSLRELETNVVVRHV